MTQHSVSPYLKQPLRDWREYWLDRLAEEEGAWGVSDKPGGRGPCPVCTPQHEIEEWEAR